MRDRPVLRLLHDGGGESIRGITREHGVSRNAVRRALSEGSLDTYHRPSVSEEYEPAVRDVLADYPHMSVPDISVMVGWPKARRTLSDLVAALRPEYIERYEADATSSEDVVALSMDSLQAGIFPLPATLTVSAIEARTLTVQEVEWWTTLEKSIPV